MSLCIVGTGMVSPAGLTPRAHACVLWAGALPPTASPFLGDGDEPVRVSYCPWLGARLDMPSRLLAMAQHALDDALRPLRALQADRAASLLVCSTPERPPLSPADHERIVQDLAGMTGARGATSFHGAAGVFAALGEAEVLLAEGAGAVAIVALDSYVGEDALAAHTENPPDPWELRAKHPPKALRPSSSRVPTRPTGLGSRRSARSGTWAPRAARQTTKTTCPPTARP
jgi:hypothetical protein